MTHSVCELRWPLRLLISFLGLSLAPSPHVAAQPPQANEQAPEAQPTPRERIIEREPTFKPLPPRARVTFNLEDADLAELVRIISNITGRRFILPSKARSIQATVFAPTKVTVAEAYRAFLSILEVHGMTVVQAGRYYKIVETRGVEKQPIPTYTGGQLGPADDRFITRLHQLENVAADDIAQLLSRFQSADGNVTAYAPTNMLILTDTGANIRRMLRILTAVDVARSGEQIWIEPVHHSDATELAERLQEILDVGDSQPPSAANRPPRPANQPPTEGGADATTIGGGEARITKILADERTNSLIILATERAYLRILELVRQLDVPLEGEGRIHVHYIQNSNAEDIAGTLSSLISGQGARRPPRAGQAGAVAQGTVDAFEGEIRVTAHEPSNALVITSSLHDYAALKRVIDELDAPRRQVFIEAVIMELSVNRSKQLGISFHGGVPNQPVKDSLTVAGFDAVRSVGFLQDPAITQDALTGLALGVRGPAIDEARQLVGISVPAFGVVINALATTGDANVLSTPHVIAMDNVEAEISVGENVPLQTSGVPPGALGLGGLGFLGQQQGQQGAAALGGLGGLGGIGAVPRQDVGTTIRITPHINEANEIRFEIEEEISQAQASTEGTLGVRTISRRTARTELAVADQQTVVIGGLINDRVLNEQTKVPILGDIPLLGMLFRQTQKTTQKTNLLLFLTPYIIRDASDLRAIFERKMRERQEFLDRYFVFSGDDYEPPVDYSRTRGLLAEMFVKMDELRDEAELMTALEARPPSGHEPRLPIGASAGAAHGERDDSQEAPEDLVIEPEGIEIQEEAPPPEHGNEDQEGEEAP